MIVGKLLTSVMLVLAIADASSIGEHLRAERQADGLCLFDVPLAGGGAGNIYSDWGPFVDSGRARITQFKVRAGGGIDCFGLTYGEIDGGCHGGTGGTEYTVEFADDEYITKIQGRSGDSFDRLTIVTNKETYGPYGGTGGNAFEVDFVGKRLAFITGRTGHRLDSVHLHFYC